MAAFFMLWGGESIAMSVKSSCPDGIRAFQSSSQCRPDDQIIGPPFQTSLEHYGPLLPDGRTTPTRQGHIQKWCVWRKHEAEPVYVANSEPAIDALIQGNAGCDNISNELIPVTIA